MRYYRKQYYRTRSTARTLVRRPHDGPIISPRDYCCEYPTRRVRVCFGTSHRRRTAVAISHRVENTRYADVRTRVYYTFAIRVRRVLGSGYKPHTFYANGPGRRCLFKPL